MHKGDFWGLFGIRLGRCPCIIPEKISFLQFYSTFNPNALALTAGSSTEYPSVAVFAKSGMCSVDTDYCGRPFGGVAVICKEIGNVTFCDLETTSDRLMPISVCDSSGNTIEIIINVYMP